MNYINNRGAFVSSISPHTAITILTDYYLSVKDYFVYGKKDKLEDVIGFTVIIITLIGAMVLIIQILTTDKYWKSNKDATPEEIKDRVAQRGLIASSITVIVFGFINGLMTVRAQSNLATYQALVGLILSGLLGFVLDNAFATEQGISLFNGDFSQPRLENIGKAVKYGFGGVWSPKMPRYIITILLDIFISLIMTDAMVKYSRNWYFFRKHKSTHSIIIMALVGFITFLAYANATRLQWSYGPTDTIFNKDYYIPTSVILLASIISGLVFLIWTPMSSPAEGIIKRSNKVILIGVLFVIIIISYYGGYLDPYPDKEIIQSVDSQGNVVTEIVEHNQKEENPDVGIAIYIILAVVLSYLTMITSPFKYSNLWWGEYVVAVILVIIPTFITLKN